MITHNGKQYARVTSILRPFSPYGHIHKDVLSNKARIGTEVHEAIAQEIAKELFVLNKDTHKYFDSFEKWNDRLTPEYVHSEKRYFCDEKMITGQIDAVIRFPGSPKLILVDFKTSAEESPKIWPMQSHLYNHLLVANGIEVDSRFLFIKLDKYGNFPKVFCYDFNKATHNLCMKAIDDFWINNKITGN